MYTILFMLTVHICKNNYVRNYNLSLLMIEQTHANGRVYYRDNIMASCYTLDDGTTGDVD